MAKEQQPTASEKLRFKIVEVKRETENIGGKAFYKFRVIETKRTNVKITEEQANTLNAAPACNNANTLFDMYLPEKFDKKLFTLEDVLPLDQIPEDYNLYSERAE